MKKKNNKNMYLSTYTDMVLFFFCIAVVLRLRLLASNSSLYTTYYVFRKVHLIQAFYLFHLVPDQLVHSSKKSFITVSVKYSIKPTKITTYSFSF